MAKRTNLLDIAKVAGVSIATVDRVINRRGGVSPAKEALVLRCAERLELDRVYFRKPLRKIRVGVVIQTGTNPFVRETSKAFEAANVEFGTNNITCFMETIAIWDAAKTAEKIRELSTIYDALIVSCPSSLQVNEQIQKITQSIPVVAFNNHIPGSRCLAYVGPDHFQSGKTAGELMGRFLGSEDGKILLLVGFRDMESHK